MTLAVLGAASLAEVDSLWGFNHLQFLSGIFAALFGVVMLVVLYLTAGPIPDSQLGEIIVDVDGFLWDKDKLPRVAVAVGAVALFFLFQVETHLLGDGYTWLAVFGHGESYIHKWTEPGSIVLLRAVQSLLGGFTKETA
ncbi:MAG: hypothetical protein KAT79_07390, partial [candidate division Zixibacteria bacterium]|nr:hypothetical protein [candidate division Zixibacteria bacterium]